MKELKGKVWRYRMERSKLYPVTTDWMQREETIKAVWDVLVKILFRKIQMHISISLAEQLKLMQKVTELTVMEISAWVVVWSMYQVPGMTETELWIMTEQRPSQVEQSLQQAWAEWHRILDQILRRERCSSIWIQIRVVKLHWKIPMERCW